MRKRPVPDPTPDAKLLNQAAKLQEEEAAALASKAGELEADGRLAAAKALTRASRHRRVESLKARALAAGRKAL